MPALRRTPIPIPVQAAVYFRDGWPCSLCRRPTIFHLALKQLAGLTAREFPGTATSYWNVRWSRQGASLMDELAACIDHVEAFATGGAHDITNFATACARCNQRKNSGKKDDFLARSRLYVAKGRSGEPTEWDGLSAAFVALARGSHISLPSTDTAWLAALEAHFAHRARVAVD